MISKNSNFYYYICIKIALQKAIYYKIKKRLFREMKIHVRTKMCTRMFIATLFMIARNGKQKHLLSSSIPLVTSVASTKQRRVVFFSSLHVFQSQTHLSVYFCLNPCNFAISDISPNFLHIIVDFHCSSTTFCWCSFMF